MDKDTKINGLSSQQWQDTLNIKHKGLEKILHFNKEDLAEILNYDLDKDELKIEHALKNNINLYQEEIESSLENLPLELEKEQEALLQEQIAYKYNPISIQEEIEKLLKLARNYHKDFDIPFYKKAVQEAIETKQDKKIQKELRSLHKNILNTWKDKLDSNILQWKNEQVTSIKNKAIERVREWLKAMQKIKQQLESMGDFKELFERYVMQSLRDGMASGKEIEEYEEPKR